MAGFRAVAQGGWDPECHRALSCALPCQLRAELELFTAFGVNSGSCSPGCGGAWPGEFFSPGSPTASHENTFLSAEMSETTRQPVRGADQTDLTRSGFLPVGFKERWWLSSCLVRPSLRHGSGAERGRPACCWQTRLSPSLWKTNQISRLPTET